MGVTLQMLRVHPTGPRSYPLSLINCGTVPDPNTGIIVLEPSRNATITEIIGVGIQVRDWTCGRSVMISTPRRNYEHAYVSTSREQSSPDERYSNVATRNLSLVYVWWEIISYPSDLGG